MSCPSGMPSRALWCRWCCFGWADSVLEVAAEGEALTWPGRRRLKLCLHLGLLLSWLDLLLLLLLLLFWAADLLGRSLHLLLLHLLLLLHWQWAEEHLLHFAHWKTGAHWGSPRWATYRGTAWETAAVRQLKTGTAARATEAEFGRAG